MALLVLPAILLALAILSTDSPAEGLSGYLEFEYNRADTELRNSGGQSIDTSSDTLSQLYNINFDKKIYPNLGLLASGLFRKRDISSETDGTKSDATTTTLRPYVNLNLRTPLYFAEAVYSRNQEKREISGVSPVTTVRESFISTLYWRPDRFPDLRLQYSHDHVYDKERLSLDTVTDLYQATSNYRPTGNLSLYYMGSLRNTDDRLSGTTTNELNNNGRVNYSNNWWRRRITLGLDYNISSQVVDTKTSGSGEVGLRVSSFNALSGRSVTPKNIFLPSNPALRDEDVSVSTGIDLGSSTLPGGGDWNMGLDFGVATEINTLYVWVDRDVEPVADTFIWQVYTSDDNQNWTLYQAVSPAVYNPTFHRFEIRFANVNAPFVKVVTGPLSPVVPDAFRFPTIQVTEMQAEVRRPAAEVAGKQTTTSQNGNLDFRAILLEPINLAYEFTCIFTKRDPGELRYTASNGLSFFRQFDKVFSGRGRVAFEIGEEPAGHREAILSTASITTVPFQTLHQSLTFSAKEETVAGKKDTNISILLYNIAKLYEGIDANLGGGISFQEDSTGQKIRNTQVNGGATFVPNRKVNLTLFYTGTTTVISGGELAGETTRSTRSGEADLAFTPVRTVYLFGSYRVETSTSAPRRDILNYSLSWTPFPDGTMHLTFNYNETIRSDDTKERSIVPSLRWYFTRRSFLNLSYQNIKSETPALTTTSNVYSGTVRIPF